MVSLRKLPIKPAKCLALKLNLLLAQDTTFDMERRRNRPEKYDREVMHKTVKAMQKIDEVKMSACIWAEAMPTVMQPA